MRVFRLTRKKYASKLDGMGAAKSNNRWNSKGTEIVYTADSRALAMAEVLVHLPLTILPKDFMMVEIEVPDALKIEAVDEENLNEDWSLNPPIATSQHVGDEFIDRDESCVLKVPSAVVPGDFNYLLNPQHREMKKVEILSKREFRFDRRMFR